MANRFPQALRPLGTLLCFLLTCIALQAADTGASHGRAMYRSNCAFCHGLTGLGGRGPDLVSGERQPDSEVKQIIRRGVPGSTMPAFGGFSDDDLDKLVRFVRSLAGGNIVAQKSSGDPVAGKLVYTKNACASCHQIGLQGSTYGPDLTRIGSARSLKYLQESIVVPSSDIPQQYEGVAVVQRDGKRVSGVRINVDNFSVQLRLPSQAFQSFIKSEVREVIDLKESLMPAYKSMSQTDLDNLLAFLGTLRGNRASGAEAAKAKGIQ